MLHIFRGGRPPERKKERKCSTMFHKHENVCTYKDKNIYIYIIILLYLYQELGIPNSFFRYKTRSLGVPPLKMCNIRQKTVLSS